jgi:RHH-type proline utilization regulon transcriptional repressor/proline dehydrogenase/delta 1-pyrroline-5-carboxylate dehydrogenase
VSAAELAFLKRSFVSDTVAWGSEFGVARDVSGLSAERNIFRYVARPVTVRLSAGEPLAALLRVIGAARLAGAPLQVSSAADVPSVLRVELATSGIALRVESDEAWLARVENLGAVRIRLIGGDPAAVAHATNGGPDISVHCNQVTESGRVEMLPFLKEQAVSITAHRFGTPNQLSDGVI